MSERKPYIDVARGILILLVVLFHTPFILRSVGCVGETPILDVVASFYIPFFMPAFFVITGMCTDWDADWNTFLVGNAKKLLLPALLLPLCATALYCERSAWYNFCDLDSWAYACVGWFVCALMTAKFVYYGVRRLVPFGNSVLLLLAVAAIVMVGLLLNKFFCLKNTLYYQNGMLFVFFVYIGELSKKKMAIFWGGRAACAIGLGYIAVWLASRLAHVDMPYVMLSVNCGYWKFPLYLCIAGGGICLLMSLAWRIGTNHFLEYMGRHSLVIYFFHSVLIFQMGRLLGGFGICDTLFVLLVFASSVAIASFIAWLFDLPYLRWLVGRF